MGLLYKIKKGWFEMNKFNELMLCKSVEIFTLKEKLKREINALLFNENGDTNFISILVLLGIALALAGVFLAFKDQVLGWVDQNIGDFFSKKGGR